ncbi:hypothetical protein EVAR_58746_1 [Eumeta japonica]|uniref:Uncharacterized protein n=1 Tax=Eumeta variegata TaxID=151549 RepID=A0A4C1YXE7_EUMVA|nr:hypothetical protein EVAR_58746_1 [Eumeta japonica]
MAQQRQHIPGFASRPNDSLKFIFSARNAWPDAPHGEADDDRAHPPPARCCTNALLEAWKLVSASKCLHVFSSPNLQDFDIFRATTGPGDILGDCENELHLVLEAAMIN